MSSTYEREREIAVQAVRQAAALCRSVRARSDPESLTKEDRSPVTVADFGSQALVCRTLAEAFPDDPVIAEEDATDLRRSGSAGLLDQVLHHLRALRPELTAAGLCEAIDRGATRDCAARFWTLDPIDGTKG